MTFQRCTVHYTGRVQGVGFRWTTSRIARSHAVTGYVKNLPDGRVELVAEGQIEAVRAFLAAVRDRMAENIREENQVPGDATGEFQAFDIRH